MIFSFAWMSNVDNEYGAILNSILTTGEGAGLKEMCQGIVKSLTKKYHGNHVFFVQFTIHHGNHDYHGTKTMKYIV